MSNRPSGRHCPNSLQGYFAAHYGNMDQVREYFVEADDITVEWEDGVDPRRLRLKGRIHCQGGIFIEVSKTLLVDDTDSCWCVRYNYQACVDGDPPRELIRYDNVHRHEGQADEHHKHVCDPTTGEEVRGSPFWTGSHGWPTLREVIDEVWAWYAAGDLQRQFATESCAKAGNSTSSVPLIGDPNMTIATRSGSEWMVERNLQLACHFDQAIMDDSSILDRIPDGATVILMPQDGLELARANLEPAMRDLQAGKDVLLIPV